MFKPGFGRSGSAGHQRPSSADPSRPMPLSLPKRIVFAVLTLFLAWGLLEISAFFLSWLALDEPFAFAAIQRRRDDLPDHFDSRDASRFARVHPYVGYVMEPTSDSGAKPFPGGPSLPISVYGYIDDKLPFQTRRPGRVVVGIVGGSVACSFAVYGTKKLEAELAKDSRFAGKEFVFVNLALGAYKQPQQLMTVAYLLSLGAQFDVILNIDGFNEVALGGFATASDLQFPAFPHNWRFRIGGADTEMNLVRSRLFVLGDERAELSQWFARAPWRYSIVCNLLWELMDRGFERRTSQFIAKYQRTGQRQAGYESVGPLGNFATSEDREKFLIDIWANSSVQLNRICRCNGIRYYHFLQPNQYVPGSKPMRDAEKRVAILESHAFAKGAGRGYPFLIQKAEYLRSLGESYHDLTGIFAGHPEQLYIDNCCHYNAEGHEIMADAIARAILDD